MCTASGNRAPVSRGANINVQDQDGNTPLHLAAAYDMTASRTGDAIAEMLDAGADAVRRNAQAQTLWDVATSNDYDWLKQSDGYWRLNDARFDVPFE